MGAAILGLGHHLPSWKEHAGVRRPIASEPGGPSDLAATAARMALANSRSSESDVDFLIFATMTPDVTFPGAGCFLQRHLGLGTIGALDVRGQCAGFLYALALANDFIATDAYQRVLVLGGEVHSSGLDPSAEAREVSRLFGDGAGAMILGPGSNGVRSVILGGDGSHHDRFWCEYPASRQHPVRFTDENLRAGQHYLKIDSGAVRKFGEEKLPQVISQALQAAATTAAEVDLFVISHVFADVGRAAVTTLGLDPARVTVPSEIYGHLSAAAIPVALSEAVSAGTIGKGSTVCLAAAGAGFTWGAAVVTL